MSVETVSKELCGGTHVSRTGSIGLFTITSESSISAGMRRIEALCGKEAFQYLKNKEKQLKAVASAVSSTPDEVLNKVEKLSADRNALEKEIKNLKKEQAADSGAQLLNNIEIRSYNGKEIKILVEKVDVDGMDELRSAMDKVTDHIPLGVVLLGAAFGGKVSFMAVVSKELAPPFDAGKLVKEAAGICGGGGGGSATKAQAGAKDASKLDEALENAKQKISEIIKG